MLQEEVTRANADLKKQQQNKQMHYDVWHVIIFEKNILFLKIYINKYYII